MEKWLSEIAMEISAECLPESYQALAEIIGVENTLKIARSLGGLVYYYPKLDNLLQKKRDDRIRREFTGCNHKELAIKYGLTERWIREIVQIKPSHDQTNLF